MDKRASESAKSGKKALLVLATAVIALLLLLTIYYGWVLFAISPGAMNGVFGPPVAAGPGSDGRSQPPDSAEARLCYQFRNRKNAGDPAAADLLGPMPSIPTAAVSPEEAERLQTDFFLRQDIRVAGVGWDAGRRKLVLVIQGNVSAPRLQVQTADGVETAQRTMANPDLTVEVRGGRIYGVAASLHMGP